MPSNALNNWNQSASAALDQIQSAHAAVGGNARGRRYATLQINHVYLVLVSSHFQRFCRDLHTEAIDYICAQDLASGVLADPRRKILRIMLSQNRQLDTKNPSPSAIGADFGRFGIEFWNVVKSQAPVQNARRQQSLENLNSWRNAIAHRDFVAHQLQPGSLTLPMVRQFRNACRLLAQRFDVVIAGHLATIIGNRP